MTLLAPRTLYGRALEIAEQHDLPAAYDAHYVALADLLRALGGNLPFVRPIAEYGS